MKSLFRLQVLLDLADKMSGPLSAPIKRIQELSHVSDAANRSLENLQAGATLTGIGVAFAAPLALATQEAIGFEEAFSDARKVIDFPTPQAPKQLQMDLLEMSNQIPRSASDLTQIAAAAGSAGIAFSELTPFIKDASEMSVAFGITADVAGDTMAKMRNVFKLTQPEVSAVGDAVNALSNKMAAEAPGILDVLRRVGATGKLVGMSAEQVSAFGSAMLSSGSAPEVISTGLNAMILTLSTATQGEKKFQNGLKDLGLSAKGVERAMREDATGALVNFLKIVDKSPDKIGVLAKLFGKEYADDMAKLVGALPLVSQGLQIVGDKTAIAGSMHAEYAIRADTAANKISLLGNRIRSTGVIIGQVALERIKPLLDKGLEMLDWIFKMARANPELIGTLVTLIGVLAAVPGGIGLVVMALSAIGTAAGQAQVGLAFLRMMVSTTQLSFTRSIGAINGFIGRLIVMGATAQGVSANLLAMNGVTTFQALKFALIGVQVALLNGARAAFTFTVALLTNPIFLAVAAVVALGAAIWWAWTNVAVFRDNVMAALQPLMQAWDGLVKAFVGFGELFGPLGAMFAQALGPAANVLDALAYGIGFALGFIFTLFVIVFSEIGVITLKGLTFLLDITRGFIDFFIGIFTLDLGRATQGAKLIMSAIQSTFGVAFTWIMDRMTEFVFWVMVQWNNLTGYFKKPISIAGFSWQGLKDSVAAIWNWITTKAVPDFLAMGRNLGQGLADGLKSTLGYLGNVAMTAAQAVNRTFATENEIKSPSRLWHYFGAMLMAGLGLGILNNTSSVQGAVVAAMPTVPAIEAPYITRLTQGGIGVPSITRLADLSAPEEAQALEQRRTVQNVQNARRNASGGIVINGGITLNLQSAPNMAPKELEAMIQRSLRQAMADALEDAAQAEEVRRAS